MGYNFIPKEYLPEGKDEYYLRFQQNPATDYRPLSAAEITVLKSNGNRCNNCEDVLVRDGIDIHLIERCTFYGLVRIGKLEPLFLEFSEFRTAVGLYNCLIVSCDIGNNVVLKNVRFLSYYIIEDDVIIANVNEMSCTSHTKFGNGIIKEGETEDVRIWLELCNENGGRKLMPFDGMLPADAWMWSKYRGDKELMEAFKRFTGQLFDSKRGYYGTVGRRTVIKNTQIIKDVKIGSDAYIKGANKLKNLTINSSADAKSQIGEGCEMVNGIMGYGSRSFYGVKAVRFILGSFSQLKYGARLINSYLGDNSTISCCEVLNSLIFPAHEQHHNNSFLCASLVMGQSNIAAGATIGSNHNSRGPDGELQAGRGFLPGLCVSLKHNSKFASYTMLAKGDYPAELNILLPFSLVSNDVHNDKLVIMPAYWMLHNMYAIARNEQKFRARDNRIQKTQLLEYDFLAPDTINEIFSALHLLKLFTGKAFYQKNKMHGSDEDFVQKGESLLENESPSVAQLDIVADGFENSQRPVQIVKVQQAYHIYKKLIVFYGTSQIIRLIDNQHITSFEALMTQLSAAIKRKSWMNIGGQLIPEEDFNDLIKDIKEVKIIGWHDVHNFYARESAAYLINKANHAIASLFDIYKIDKKDFTPEFLIHLFSEFLATKEWMVKNIVESKAKDYKNPFRKMVYDSAEEMENVVGRLEDNPFINEQTKELSEIKQKVAALITAFS